MAEWRSGRIAQRIDWHPELFSLAIDAEINPYQAGQFIKLGIRGDDGRVTARAYSLVNPPGSRYHSILAVEVKDGAVSPFLHQLQVGDELLVSPTATGFLTLDQIPDGQTLWLLATGTGISPFLSMLATAEPWQRYQQLVLVYAVREVRDLAYLAMIEGWQQQYGDQFRFLPVVSREQHGAMLHGRIPQLLADGSLEQRAELPLATTSQVLLCGNPGMIHDTSELLLARGLRRHRRADPGNLHSERYW